MTLSAGPRKLVLTMHIVVSVGFAGAVACFLSLAIAGATSHDAELVRASYRALQLMTWTVVLPLAFASLLSGVVSSLGTNWGLFRYYWIVVKLAATAISTLILLVHLQPIDALSHQAQLRGGFSDLRDQQWMMAAASSLALIVLIVLTVLSVYKPQGLTPYGVRKQTRRRESTFIAGAQNEEEAPDPD